MAEEKKMDRKAELLAKKAAREAAMQAEKESHEMALLELEDSLSELGVRGRAFEILDLGDLGEGLIAVKVAVPGIQASYKAFTNSKKTEADLDSFVCPSIVHPEVTKAREIFARRPEVGYRAAEKLMHLLGMKRADSEGK